MSESNQVQLVSLGPLLLGQNNTELEDNPCVKQSTSKSLSAQNYGHNVNDYWQLFSINVFPSSVFQVTVYTLSGVGAALLLILLFTVWSNITKCHKTETETCDAQADREQCQ